jgi:peptidyl-prolyl cis-trans isomerase C
MSLKATVSILFLFSLLFSQLTKEALSADATAEIASVNGTPITTGEFEKRMERLTGEGQGNFDSPEGKEELLDILIAREVLTQEGKRLGLEKKKEVKDRIDELTKEVVINEVVNYIGTEKINDAEMKKYYEKNKGDFREVRASHILVKTEDEAKEVKKKLDGGADFAALAKEKSQDPGSARQGGDLGFFTKDRMVKPFAEAAFTMKPNEISKPVKSAFGFHVIKVMEIKEPKNFQELTPAQIQGLRGVMINSEIDQLKEKAKIKINKERLQQASSHDAAPAGMSHDAAAGGQGGHTEAPPSKK